MTLPDASPARRRPTVATLSILLGVLAPLAACGDGEVSEATNCPPTVTIAVGAGTTPFISWTPRCRLGEIIVDPNSDFIDYWALRSKDLRNGLLPPIRYGAAPSGTETLLAAFSLSPGTSYRVRVFTVPADTTLAIVPIGATYFTP